MAITLRQLQVFDSVVEVMNFTQAAHRLHMTQPGVSQQLKQLEAGVGVDLFSKQGKRMILTEAGSRMQGYARSILTKVEEMKLDLAELERTQDAQLRITVASSVGQFAVDAIARFVKQCPDTQVRLNVLNRETVMKQLEDFECDLLLMGSPPKDRSLQAVQFMHNPLVVIAAPGHALAKQWRKQPKPIPLAEFIQQTVIEREAASGTRLALDNMLAQHGLELTETMEMNSNETTKQSVIAGLGIAVVSEHTVQKELAAGELCSLNVEHFPIVRDWYLVHKKQRYLPARAAAFKAFILEESAT